jgi:hypothetical protein
MRQIIRRKTTGETITIEVTGADVERRPARETFRLRFDPPRSILDPHTSISYENCADFSLLDRPGFNEGARRVIMPKSPAQPRGAGIDMPGEATPSYFRSYATLGAAAIALIGTWLVLSRHRTKGVRG